MNEMHNLPPLVGCFCFSPEYAGACICTPTERALRAWSAGKLEGKQTMTPGQRAWCLDEIRATEGYDAKYYTNVSDQRLAEGVLRAWQDYCRDKGLLP